jgi:hypothetical protein
MAGCARRPQSASKCPNGYIWPGDPLYQFKCSLSGTFINDFGP